MAARRVKTARAQRLLSVGLDVPSGDGPAKIVAIERDKDGRVQVLLDHGDVRSRVPWLDVVRAALTRRPLPPDDLLATFDAPSLAELPKAEQEGVNRRFRDLLQIEYGSPRGDPDGDRRAGLLSPEYDPQLSSRPERLMAKSHELQTRMERGSSRAALYRQLKALQSGPDALIHGNTGIVAQSLDEVDPVVLDLIRTEVVAEQTRSRKSQRKLLARIRAKMDGVDIGSDLSYRQLSVLIGEASRGLSLHHSAKTRRSEASRPVSVYGARRVARPGELVQVDATPTTLSLLARGGVLVPAVILSAIDVHTRCFVAMRVCTGAATSRDVCALIAQMGRPTITRSGYPYELVYWHGVPQLIVINDDPVGEKTSRSKVIGSKPAIHPATIVFDHGSENASDHVMRYAAECGIDVVFCPPRAGHAKGIVEAVHRVVNGVESAMPIHKGENVLNRPLELEVDVPVTPQDLQDMLWEYILDVYSLEAHAGLTDAHGSDIPLTPQGVWANYVTNQGWLEVPEDPFAFLKGLEREQRLLQPNGITILKTTYNSSELQDLRSIVMSGIGTKARPVTVFFDRLDTTRIFLIHPTQRHWLMVPRARDRDRSRAPMSTLVRQLAAREHKEVTHRPLTQEQLHRAEAALLSRWNQGAFKDHKDARYAAIEEGRQRTYAHDLEEASEEVRLLAFPAAGPASEPQSYPEGRDDDADIDFEELITAEEEADDHDWGLA